MLLNNLVSNPSHDLFLLTLFKVFNLRKNAFRLYSEACLSWAIEAWLQLAFCLFEARH